MDDDTKSLLAAAVVRDMELLRHRAEVDGVLAYSRKAVPREVPNERFLQNTLKNLGSGLPGSVKFSGLLLDCQLAVLRSGLLSGLPGSARRSSAAGELLKPCACSKQAQGGGPPVGQQGAPAAAGQAAWWAVGA